GIQNLVDFTPIRVFVHGTAHFFRPACQLSTTVNLDCALAVVPEGAADLDYLCRVQLDMLYLYSEVVMLAIRLPMSIEKRLEKLARRTGRTKTYYVREAILEHLEDLEDLYLAEGT